MVDLRAYGRARALGALQEAERLGSTVIGTEHLLIATLADPAVRWAFRTVGIDMGEVQDEVAKATAARRTPLRCGPITKDAADAVMQISGEALDADNSTTADKSRALQALVQRFLCRTKATDARDILDTLGAVHLRTRVLATIEHNARRTQPSDPADQIAPSRSVKPRQSRRLRTLNAELHRPDPSAPA